MNRRRRMPVLAAAACSIAALPMFAGSFSDLRPGSILAHVAAAGQVTPAMDRIPSDAAVTIGIKDMGKLKAGIESMAKALGVPAEAMGGMLQIDAVFNMQGLDTSGSAAIGIMSVDSEEPDAIAIVPVRDYANFIKGLGGTGSGLEELKLDEKPVFVKNIEGGFAAFSPNKDIVEKFAGKPGNAKAHADMMGAAGKSIAESRDVVIVANISRMGDKIKESLQGLKDGMGMAMMMAGGGGDLGFLDSFTEAFVRDASAGIIGANIGEEGLTLDFAAQFKEGTEYAGYFNSKGKANQLLAALPNQQILFAVAMDTSGPGMKTMIKQMEKLGKMMQPQDDGAAPGMFPQDWAQQADGMAFQVGNSPAPVGGLLLNTVAYIKSSNPQAFQKGMKDGLTAVNSKTIQGITYTTSYQENVKAGERTADVWSMKMAADPEDPEAQMMNQMNFMLFGPNGLGGYSFKTDDGLILTYAKNADLLGQSVAAGKGGDNMTADADIKAIAAKLPSDRTMEGYIGVKSLLDTLLGVLGPMGMAPNIEVPESIPPVGMGATTDGGGLRMTVVIPTKVMTSIKAMADAMDMGGGGDGEDDAGQLKF